MTPAREIRNKADEAYRKIKKWILGGEVTPKTAISEEIFCRRLDLGRTPVREAVKRLVYEGYITQTPKGGICIQRASLQECKNLCDLRFALEEYVLKSLLLPLPSKKVEKLESLLVQQAAAVKSGKVKTFMPLDVKFHVYLFELYGNEIFIDTYRELRNKFQVAGPVIFNGFYGIDTAYEEHRAIAEALKSGSNAAAVMAVRTHLAHAQRQPFNIDRMT